MTNPDDTKPTSQLTPPADEVHKKILEKFGMNSAASYSDKALRKQQQVDALKGKGPPLGGAPPLDSDKLSAAMPKPAFPEPPRSVQEPTPDSFEKTSSDPKVQSGVGAAYEVNRAMARGEIERPVTLGEAKNMEAKKGLSPESIEALKKVADAAQEPEEPAQPSISVSEPKTKQRLEDSEKDLVDLPFEFGAVHDERAKMLSDRRRKVIEKRLDPLHLEDMIINKEIVQTIPVIPDKLAVTLRTFNQREHLFCLRYVYKTGGSQLFVEELLNTCKLVCSLFAVNGAVLPDHRVHVGERGEEVDEDRFEDKMFHLASFPVQLLADFSVQMIWFNDRVNKLMSLDNLKNG